MCGRLHVVRSAAVLARRLCSPEKQYGVHGHHRYGEASSAQGQRAGLKGDGSPCGRWWARDQGPSSIAGSRSLGRNATAASSRPGTLDLQLQSWQVGNREHRHAYPHQDRCPSWLIFSNQRRKSPQLSSASFARFNRPPTAPNTPLPALCHPNHRRGSVRSFRAWHTT